MPIYAFKNGVTPFAENIMNQLLSLQSFALIYDGNQIAAKAGAGIAEFDCASYDHIFSFSLTGTEISRIELELVKHGKGADLVVEIHPNVGGFSETILKSVVAPKEFIPTGRSYFSIPIDLSGLSAGLYWVRINRAGDATNHFHIHGETTSDSAAFRRPNSSSGWAVTNTIHFKIFSGEAGELKHGIYGQNGYTTVEYAGEVLSKVYRYLPPSDGPAGGIRDVITYQWSGEYLKRGDV